MQTSVPKSLITLQAVALFAIGLLVLLYSQSLTMFLIHMVGEERALGRGSVIQKPDGGILLTNPTAMLFWMIPILLIVVVLISSAINLARLGYLQFKSS